nr:murein L,D-transpeptidase catalytic domain family protein [Phyllobacterium myrsinacearum]
MVFSASPQLFAAERQMDTPLWLKVHIGENEGQIAPPVLQRARALYVRKVREGTVKNPCYFAMDATRPNDLNDGKSGGRFYTICEAAQTFRVISSGHGSGRNLKGVADFANGRECARNFGNAMDSNLTAGGMYVTGETKTSFKGYYRVSGTKDAALLRSFIQFDGEGETANARQRAIGGHAAAVVAGVCLKKNPESRYANRDGFVPLGKLVEYAGGRSDGCTSWTESDAGQIISMVKDNPTTLYIYPESADIAAIAKAVASGRSLSKSGLYWNESCLKEIGVPKFWPKENLEPIIAQYGKDHPARPLQPIPLCDVP